MNKWMNCLPHPDRKVWLWFDSSVTEKTSPLPVALIDPASCKEQQKKMTAWAVVISGLNWKRLPFQVYAHGCWKDSVPMGCWTEGLSSLLAFTRGHPQFLTMWASPQGTSHMTTCFMRASKQEAESASNMRVTVFYNLVSKVTSCHFLLYSFHEKQVTRSNPHSKE